MQLRISFIVNNAGCALINGRIKRTGKIHEYVSALERAKAAHVVGIGLTRANSPRKSRCQQHLGASNQHPNAKSSVPYYFIFFVFANCLIRA